MYQPYSQVVFDSKICLKILFSESFNEALRWFQGLRALRFSRTPTANAREFKNFPERPQALVRFAACLFLSRFHVNRSIIQYSGPCNQSEISDCKCLVGGSIWSRFWIHKGKQSEKEVKTSYSRFAFLVRNTARCNSTISRIIFFFNEPSKLFRNFP